MKYKCAKTTCKDTYLSYKSVIDHCISEHSGENIKLKKLTINTKSSQIQWNLISYNIIPAQGTVIIDTKNEKVRFKRRYGDTVNNGSLYYADKDSFGSENRGRNFLSASINCCLVFADILSDTIMCMQIDLLCFWNFYLRVNFF